MEDSDGHTTQSRCWLLFLPALRVITAILTFQEFQAAGSELTASATYVHGVLDLTIPYHAAHAGAGQLTVEVLDPEDQILGRVDQPVEIGEGKGHWKEKI